VSSDTTACAAAVTPTTSGRGDAAEPVVRTRIGPSSFPTAMLDVDDAVRQVRRGDPVPITDGADTVLSLPAAVMGPAAAAAIATHGRATVVVPRSTARRVGIERYGRGVALAGADRDVVAIARALTNVHADHTWFDADPAGMALEVVDDRGVECSDRLSVLASELTQLAGFGRVTVLVAIEHRVVERMLVATSLIGRALGERGPLPMSGPARLPLGAGSFLAYAVRAWDGVEHLVITAPGGPQDGPIRVTRTCLIGQTFRSRRCSCRDDLDRALADLAGGECGAIVCLLPAAGAPGNGLVSCPAAVGSGSAREQVLAEAAVDQVRRVAVIA